MNERVMFPLIKTHLEKRGFLVKAEVADVDIMAVKNDKTLLVEMKTTFSLSLIYQGIERQRLSDYVYLAILKPTNKTLSARTFKEKKAIVKRLGLGLIIVDVSLKQLTFLLDPALPHQRKDKKKQRKLNHEFLLRQTALNEGGVTQTKIITAYRELALTILDCLRDGEQPVQAVVKHTGQMKATRVLIDNHYGWFKRTARGVYALSSEGDKALNTYADVLKVLTRQK